MTDKDDNAKGHEQRSKSTHRTSGHLSVDTRLAARAILDDHAIGRTATEPTTKEPSGFIEWLQRVRLKLSFAVCLIAGILTTVPIWYEVNSRAYANSLQSALVAQAKTLANRAGKQKISQWFSSNNLDAMRAHYVENRQGVLDGLESQGFTVDENNLKVRLDYQNKVMILGVIIVDGSGRNMTWASPTEQAALRTLPKASLSVVFSENRDMIALLGTALGLCLAFVWLAPVVYRRRRTGE